MDEKELHQLHLTELEIMDVIHNFCMEHHLKYSLAYGTLLGAVRHQGFIPWDDDMDICMPRDDYDKFIELWQKNPPKGFVLQYKVNSPEFSENFLKVRKDHTTMLCYEAEKQYSYHKGVFVDIFPGDNAPDGKLSRNLQFCFSAVMLLFYRGYASGNGGVTGLIERLLLSLPKRWHSPLRTWAENGVKQWNEKKTRQIIFPSTINDMVRYYDADIFDRLREMAFEDRAYCCFDEFDAVLRTQYGAYMELPPEEDRVLKHHPYLVDFEHNYEEL